MRLKMTKFSEVIKKKGITQVELARLSGVKQPNIAQLAKKGIFNVKTANKYSKFLKCSPFSLIENIT